MDIQVTHNDSADRYELTVDGQLASYAEYTPYGDVLVFDHTVTHPDFRGQGLAAKVVAFALDDVRKTGGRIVPACSFVADYVRTHPGYGDLVEHRRSA